MGPVGGKGLDSEVEINDNHLTAGWGRTPDDLWNKNQKGRRWGQWCIYTLDIMMRERPLC